MGGNRQTNTNGQTRGLPKQTSIRTKIIVVVVMASFVTACLTTAMHIRLICRNILDETRLQVEALALPIRHTLNSVLGEGSGQLDFGRLAQPGVSSQVESLLRETVTWPGRNDLLAAYLVDSQGQVLVEAGKSRMVGSVPAEVFNSRVKGARVSRIVRIGNRYDTFVPNFSKEGIVTGYITVGIAVQSLWDRATQMAAAAVISFSIICVITVGVLALWVSRFMVNPLEQITKSIVQGAKDGKPHLGRLTESSDEIGHLARVTNEVLPELYRQQRELKLTSQQLTSENNKLERTKRSLMEMERRYRSAVEAATGVAYALDLATGKFEFLSRAVYETVGFAAEDLSSSDVWTEHIHEDDRAAAEEALAECLNSRKSCFSRSYRFICKDGHELGVVELGGLMLDEAGRPSRISGIIMPAHMLPKSVLASS